MRFKLSLEYVGTRYSGWQIQKNARTVQGEIHRAVQALCDGREFELHGAGRTDAGVHALHQVAHLDIPIRLPAATLLRRINDELPADINILAAQEVPHRFHARHDAVARSYLYQIARRRTAMGKAFVWWVKDELDVSAMERAAARFLGMKDFKAFTADEPGSKSTLVLIDRLELAEEGALVLIRVQGSHFLWKMVRRMVGVMAEVGRGALRADQVSELLLEDSGATAARLTAPPSGLFLERVYYPGDRREHPLVGALRVAG